MSDATPTVEKPAEGAPPAPAGKPSALLEDEITRLNDEIVIAALPGGPHRRTDALLGRQLRPPQ